jgi:hypothetical protein
MRVVVEKERSKELITKANSVAPHEASDKSGASTATPAVRTALKTQFDKAHRKTTKVHAGLFRRLAK